MNLFPTDPHTCLLIATLLTVMANGHKGKDTWWDMALVAAMRLSAFGNIVAYLVITW